MTLQLAVLASIFSAAIAAPISPWTGTRQSGPGIRALIVTGGHDFEREPFFDLFRSLPGLSFKEAVHSNAHKLFKPDAAKEFDVLVLYDMWQTITEEAKADLVNLVKQGKPVVALHHCLAGYNDWPEYARMIGGRYRLNKETVNGKERQGSVYLHGMSSTIKIADSRHPITRGLKDFPIVDETYGDFDVDPGVKPLLTNDHPTSSKTVAWCHTYGKSRVVYIQLGHGPEAFENPSYHRLVGQAIRWVSKR